MELYSKTKILKEKWGINRTMLVINNLTAFSKMLIPSMY
ncbi:hypothetical protein CbC4_5087 (plasmid) [Clostridium botulinum BKT015925]|nr:hypothetical protein CbC4_5087 [Clostridium botulinum BKT015925]